MEIVFTTRKLQRACESLKNLTREWGPEVGPRVGRRLQELAAFVTLGHVPVTPPFRRHQLSQNRDEEFAVVVIGKYRLVFEPASDPVPRTEDGGIDLERVTAIRILEVVDYHDN